jgi:hypothetical protein
VDDDEGQAGVDVLVVEGIAVAPLSLLSLVADESDGIVGSGGGSA